MPMVNISKEHGYATMILELTYIKCPLQSMFLSMAKIWLVASKSGKMPVDAIPI